MDLAAACFREGRLADAEAHARSALDLDYALPGLAHNLLACVAAKRGDVAGMKRHFADALGRDPQHWVLQRNVRAANAWWSAGGAESGLPPELEADHEFQLLERPLQPSLPGPLPPDFAVWQDAQRAAG
jgi:Flp pilus assembly protein TadD